MSTRFFLPTVVCGSIRDDANHLAMVLGEGPADALTWSLAQWTLDGQDYATRNLWVTQEWMDAAQAPLQRPAWDSEQPYTVNMAAAARAQAAIVIWNGEGDLPAAAPGKILCVPGANIQDVIAAMGLTLVEVETSEAA